MLFFDITKKKSFGNLTEWAKLIEEYGGSKSLIYLVGTKKDMIVGLLY